MSTTMEDENILIQNEEFLEKTYRAAMWPGMLSILSGCINIIADGVLVGQKIGAGGLAAINLCVPVYLALCIAGSFFVSGAAICSSREIGANRRDKAGLYYRYAVTLCLIASVVMTAVGILLTDEIAAFLCRDSEILPMVKDYALVTLAGAFPKIFLYVPFWYLRLDGRNKTVTVMMTVMGAGNVALDFVFLYGFDMGVFGAALASVIATAAACVLGFASLHRGTFHFKPGPALPGKEEFRELAVVGSPAAMNNLVQTLRLLCVNGLLQRYGGSMMLAEFSVLNGISAFAEAVTVGVPQAGTAMMGVYRGERDNESIRILLRLEMKKGVLYCLIFGTVIVLGADIIAAAYGLDQPMRFPMLCLAVSLIPSLWNNVLASYYSVSGHAGLSNLIIILKAYVFSAISLWVLLVPGITPWLFLTAGELLTICVWYLLTGFLSRRKEMTSRYFLMDQTLEKAGRVINFSMISDNEKICEASERITDFCQENGMEAKQVMRVSLALEEMMTLITSINEPQRILFDIRVYAVPGEIGIRIRYNGKKFDPLSSGGEEDDDMLYMGMRMLQKLVKQVDYQDTFGMNTLLILL